MVRPLSLSVPDRPYFSNTEETREVTPRRMVQDEDWQRVLLRADGNSEPTAITNLSGDPSRTEDSVLPRTDDDLPQTDDDLPRTDDDLPRTDDDLLRT